MRAQEQDTYSVSRIARRVGCLPAVRITVFTPNYCDSYRDRYPGRADEHIMISGNARRVGLFGIFTLAEIHTCLSAATDIN